MIRLMICFSLFFSLTLNSIVYGQNDPRYAADEAAIQGKLEQLSAYIMAADLGQIASCYTWDGLRYPKNRKMDQVSGKQKDFWHVLNEEKITFHEIEIVDLKIRDYQAVCFGNYAGRSLNADGSESAWEGKFHIQWQKVDNTWKIVSDGWGRSMD